MSAPAPPRSSIPTRRDTLLAALWMTGAIASFTAMAVAGRMVSGSLDTFEIMLYRSAIGLVVLVSAASFLGRTRRITTNRLGLHTVRNVAHFAGQNLWFAAIAVAPLAQVIALEFTSPLWALLLSALLLGERPGPARIAMAGVGFGGVLLVARPFSGAVEPGLALAALAAIGFALTAVLTRSLTRSESTWSILFWLTAMQLPMALVCAGLDGAIAWPGPEAWPWVGTIAAAGLLAHTSLTNALALAPAHTVMPFDFARLPIVALAGMLLFGEALDPWVLVGGAVILGAAWANLRLGSGRGHVAEQTPGG